MPGPVSDPHPGPNDPYDRMEQWQKELQVDGFKYFVLKMDDVFASLTSYELEDFNECLYKYNARRKRQGKPVNAYWVVNRDEPYADIVKDLIFNEADTEAIV